MEKIKLINDKTYDLVNCGIREKSDLLSVKILPGSETLEEIESVFNDNSSKILLVSDSGETLRIFNGYTEIVNIGKEKDAIISTEVINDEEVVTVGDVVTIGLRKEDETEVRLSALEETVDLLVLDSLGI